MKPNQQSSPINFLPLDQNIQLTQALPPAHKLSQAADQGLEMGAEHDLRSEEPERWDGLS